MVVFYPYYFLVLRVDICFQMFIILIPWFFIVRHFWSIQNSFLISRKYFSSLSCNPSCWTYKKKISYHIKFSMKQARMNVKGWLHALKTIFIVYFCFYFMCLKDITIWLILLNLISLKLNCYLTIKIFRSRYSIF